MRIGLALASSGAEQPSFALADPTPDRVGQMTGDGISQVMDVPWYVHDGIPNRIRAPSERSDEVPLGPGLFIAGQHLAEDDSEPEAQAETDQHARQWVAGDRALDATIAVGNTLSRRVDALLEPVGDIFGPLTDLLAGLPGLLAHSAVVLILTLSALFIGRHV
jgi:hypothetical protein